MRWRLRSTNEIIEEERFALSDLPTSQWPDDELMRYRARAACAPGHWHRANTGWRSA